MKHQIKRLSPHQNGKVFGIMMAAGSLIFIIPMFLFSYVAIEHFNSTNRPMHFPMTMFLVMPIFYLIFGYLSVACGCLIYNALQRFMGGIEFELTQLEKIIE